eukprot:jgi/Botrbrau1/1487/Bobra.178_3s0042.1
MQINVDEITLSKWVIRWQPGRASWHLGFRQNYQPSKRGSGMKWRPSVPRSVLGSRGDIW